MGLVLRSHRIVRAFANVVAFLSFEMCGGATTTSAFREHLEEFFGLLPARSDTYTPRSLPSKAHCHLEQDDSLECPLPQRNLAPVSPLTVLELGTMLGSTTAFLSAVFHRVIAVDFDANWLQAARKRQDQMGGLPNVVFLHLDLYSDNLNFLKNNQIEIVFIDAAHDYPSVKSDALHALQIPTVEWIVFHDYAIFNRNKGIRFGMQVKLVVDELVTDGFLDCGPGSPPPPARPHSEVLPARGGGIGYVKDGLPEGVLCHVTRRWNWMEDASWDSFVVRRSYDAEDVHLNYCSKLNLKVWHLYEPGHLHEIPAAPPAAQCTVRLSLEWKDVECTGKLLSGKGTVSLPSGFLLFQRWHMNQTSVTVKISNEFTSLHGEISNGAVIYGFTKNIFEGSVKRELQLLHSDDFMAWN